MDYSEEDLVELIKLHDDKEEYYRKKLRELRISKRDEMPRLTKRQSAIVSAYTGALAGKFSDVHEYIEELMQRSVWRNELSSPALAKELHELSRDDFLAICNEGDTDGD